MTLIMVTHNRQLEEQPDRVLQTADGRLAK